MERVRDDAGGTENKTLKRYQVIEAMTDIRTWLIVLTTLLSQSVDELDEICTSDLFIQRVFPMAH